VDGRRTTPASTLDLLRYALGGGGDPSQLFLPKPKTERGSANIPVITPLSGLAVKRYSDTPAPSPPPSVARGTTSWARERTSARR
jgi:hypothetical protein